MATRTATAIQTQVHPNAMVIEWTGLATSDDGSWELLAHYRNKCLHVYGTFNGAIVTLEGTNETSSPAHYVSLSDPLQNGISFTADGIREVLENPMYVRPRVAGGDGSTSLTARLACK